MFLTKIDLDPTRRLARKYLGSRQVMHAVVLRATGSDTHQPPGRVLWRVDHGASTSLYVLSSSKPDFSQILDDAGGSPPNAQTLDYTPFLNRLATGQRWAFRLAANPSRAVSQGPGVRGKRYGHVTVEQQRQWLVDRANTHGFELTSSPANDGDRSLVVVRSERPVFSRENRELGRRDRVTINCTVYEGVLEVSDADVLRSSLVSGIGRSKAYGCGLMTLARARRG